MVIVERPARACPIRAAAGPLPLRRARRQRHERAGPVPGRCSAAARAAATARFDRGERADARAQLERLGIAHPSAGRQRRRRPTASALVVSTAVEEQVPDVAAARAPRHADRPPLRAARALRRATTARSPSTGTSGKSTVVAMIFEILRGRRARPVGHHRRRPAGARSARACGATRGRRHPTCWWSRPTRATARWCATSPRSAWCSTCSATTRRWPRSRACSRRSARARARRWSSARGRTSRRSPRGATRVRLRRRAPTCAATARRARARRQPLRGRGRRAFALPVPGRHNVENALAAIAACRAVGVPLGRHGRAARALPGRGAALPDRRARRAASRCGRLRAQPGQDRGRDRDRAARAPAACSRSTSRTATARRASCARDFVDTFATRAAARGPAVDARDLLRRRHRASATSRPPTSSPRSRRAARGAEFAPSREWLVERVAAEARAGDLVLVMGARDPVAHRPHAFHPRGTRAFRNGVTCGLHGPRWSECPGRVIGSSRAERFSDRGEPKRCTPPWPAAGW